MRTPTKYDLSLDDAPCSYTYFYFFYYGFIFINGNYIFPGALAGKIAFPDKQAFAVCGDGGFGMTMNDFVTSVKYKLPITTRKTAITILAPTVHFAPSIIN
ncbi:hypothetical protein CN491_03675 [Bacillus cereus]|uniref:Thiamine pyrophosphate enzyme TPP-binding domain-containing protein n=1 Tax=Bacillus cereus TaxID=1396 RepID=A0A2A8LUW3_BACCE|nr:MULTISPECIES: thiamine pyrophosphate-dependent enzyme [Bacillus cereus group]PES98162.1 hypothetical protein CN491_03675 [Bacillus cereus]